jgi:hypothetical protein
MVRLSGTGAKPSKGKVDHVVDMTKRPLGNHIIRILTRSL